MPDARRRAPLAHRRPARAPEGRLRLDERPFLGKLALQGEAGALAGGVQAATGLALPTETGGSSGDADAKLLWLGPGEWLLLCAADGEAELARKLDDALGEVPHQLVDVTHQHSVLELAGAAARDTLAKLTPLDLHPRHFAAGRVAATRLGRIAGVILQVADDTGDDGPVFQLLTRRSTADYLYDLLLDAGREFGLSEQA